MQEVYAHAWANPSSLHGHGLAAAEALERARQRMVHLLGVPSQELLITSGATESVHLALLGAAAAQQPAQIVISAVEHPAVVAAAESLQSDGWQLKIWPVGPDGGLRMDLLDAMLAPPTRLVSLNWGQSEIGTLQPIIRIGEACRQRAELCCTPMPRNCCHRDARTGVACPSTCSVVPPTNSVDPVEWASCCIAPGFCSVRCWAVEVSRADGAVELSPLPLRQEWLRPLQPCRCIALRMGENPRRVPRPSCVAGEIACWISCCSVMGFMPLVLTLTIAFPITCPWSSKPLAEDLQADESLCVSCPGRESPPAAAVPAAAAEARTVQC